MTASAIMIQGTTSDAGKSMLATGLCRVLVRRGWRVCPFKPQNMALNSAVTVDGGEIGRAQALQAQACMLEPHSDMNPVLLKPNTNTGAQVICQGRVLANMTAVEYHAYKPVIMSSVLASYRRLSASYDIIVVEGAGSPAEINLREGDVANMGFAEAVDCPVLLVADIDRGGVFAHIAGTLDVLSPSERARIRGFVINRFRGDKALLDSGLEWLQERTGRPVLGVLPFIDGLHLEAEDSLTRGGHHRKGGAGKLKVVIPVYPRLSNHTDFDALRLHPDVDVRYLRAGETIPAADLIVMGGSKSVVSDLQWLRRHNWHQAILKHLRYGGRLLGICGGFQMLGNAIHDPHGVEGEPSSCAGLRLLDFSTTLGTEKQLSRQTGTLTLDNALVDGYEIHMGVSAGHALKRPAVRFDDGRCDGALSEDGQILGTYLHGLFDHAESCQAILRWAGLPVDRSYDYRQIREENINRVADCIEQHIDLDWIEYLLQRVGAPAVT